MLRITPSASASQAKTYYTTGDYFLGEQERPGTWHGKAAERLGLRGEVRREQWDALCDNLDPNTGKRLTQRTQKDRRVGYDFTFDVPKSVSLLYALSKDERIVEAFLGSVDDTMAEIEREMKTRVRKGGADADRIAGEAAWGTFVHFTTRPEGGIPDPHLHAHCFVFNTTWDKEERRWKAGQFGDLKRDGAYFEGLHQVRLAERIAKLGLPVERTRTGWEIAGVDRSTVRKFSRRTERIEQVALGNGITDPKEKGELGAKTRNRKGQRQPFDQLTETWRSWLSPDESATMLTNRHRLDAGQSEFRDDVGYTRHALNAALSHHFERASVVPERKLLATALKRSAGHATIRTVLDQYARAGVIVGERDGQRVVTTREVLNEERQMIAFAREGRGTCRPLGTKGYELKDKRLSESQANAAKRILTSPDRVILLRGAAGTGKTTLMKEAIAGIEAGGRKIFTFAPSAAASRGVLREEQVDDKADTVAFLLKNERLHPELQGQVIWIDEAGLVGTKTLREVFQLARRVDARVILSGDKRQHGSVERGAALHLLETEAGLVPAQLAAIRRQTGGYRDVVQALADGKTKAGLEQLQALDWVHELPGETRYDRLAYDYADALKALKPGQKIIAIAPSHKESETVTQAIRGALKATGRLSSAERTFTALKKTNLTVAERADAVNYREGDMVVFHQNAKGRKKGERLPVNSGAANIPLDQADKFQLFNRGTIALAPGDDIRITQGGESLGNRLNNGAIYTVDGFTKKGDIKLTNGWTIGKDFGHFAYGWCSTSHSAQGKSVERVFIAQSADSYPASSENQWYVSVSRGKHRADIYCEDAQELLKAVERSDERLSATELVNGSPPRQRSMEPIRNRPPLQDRPLRSREREREELTR